MARKRLNKSLIIALTLSVFVVMIIASALMLSQLRRGDPKHFVATAERFAEQENWGPAALFYGKAYEKSDDPIYLVLQGDMALREDELSTALYCWRQALVNDPNLIEAHKRQLDLFLELATLYGGLDRWLPVAETADALLKVEADRTNEELAFARHANGLALVNLASQDEANVEKGLADLKTAAELDPANLDYTIDYAAACIRLDRADEGDRLLRELVERFSTPGPDASKARMVYAKYLAARRPLETAEQSIKEAERYFEQSLKLADGDAESLRAARLEYASFLGQRWIEAIIAEPDSAEGEAMRARAEAMLKQCIESDPEPFDAYLQLAILHRAARKYAEQVEVCEQRLSMGFSRRGIRATHDKVSAFKLMTLASEGCVILAVEAGNSNEPAKKEEFLKKAVKYIADANGEFPDHPDVLSQSGRLKLARGQERAALDDLRRADESYRARNIINWDNKLVLARLHLKLDEPGAAREVLEDVLKRATGRRRMIFSTLYAETLLRTSELDRALAVVHRVLLRDPDNVDARRVKAAVYALQGLHERAGALVDSPLLRALLEAREQSLAGDTQGAVEVQLKALESNPADARLVGPTVNDLLSLDRTEEARAVLQRALQVDPDNTFFAKLMVLARKDLTLEQRKEELLKIIEAEPDEYQKAWDLIDFHLRNDDMAGALNAINRAERHLIEKDTPFARNATMAQHRALLEVKLRVAAQLDDTAALEEARSAAEKYDVDGAGGKTILGLYHVHRNEMELAIAAFRAVVDVHPTDARSLTRLARCLQIVGRTSEARRHYERAVRVSPNEAAAHRGLAMLAKAQGETETYEKELDICEKLIPRDDWVKAQLLARQEDADPQAAISRRVAMLKENPDDRSNLYRLATLSEAAGDIPRADRYWGLLLDLVMDDGNETAARSSVAVGAEYFRRTGRPDKALDLVRRYSDSRENPEEKANAEILVAAHYLSEGKFDLVQTTLLAAADITPTLEIMSSIGEFYLRNADRPAEALEWYDRAVRLAREKNLPQLKQMLITRITCLLHRGLNDIDTARKYVNELIAEFPDDPEGILLGSEVHARTGRINEAVAALSAYLEKRPDDVYALSQRARHYESQGLIAQAIEDLETIKRLDISGESAVNARILLARLHFQAGHRGAWLRELEALATDAPDSATAVEELINAYIHEKRYEDADRFVTARINRSEDATDPRWLFMRGRISLELEDFARALDDVKRGARMAEFSSESVIRVLDAFLRAGRFDEGVDYYERRVTDETRTPVLISRYARLLIGDGKTREAVEQFRMAMDRAAAVSPEAVRSVAADIRALTLSPQETIDLFEGSAPTPKSARANDRILASLYRTSDRTSEAIAKLERLAAGAASDSERAQLFVELAECYHSSGDPRRARQAYEESLKSDSDNWVALNNLAYVLSDSLGEYAVALPYAKRAVEIADTSGTLDTLGWIYVGLEQYEPAAAELSQAIRLDPEMALAYYHLGEAYRRNGRFIEAARVLKEGLAIARKGGDEELASRLDDSLGKTDRRDKAP